MWLGEGGGTKEKSSYECGWGGGGGEVKRDKQLWIWLGRGTKREVVVGVVGAVTKEIGS